MHFFSKYQTDVRNPEKCDILESLSSPLPISAQFNPELSLVKIQIFVCYCCLMTLSLVTGPLATALHNPISSPPASRLSPAAATVLSLKGIALQTELTTVRSRQEVKFWPNLLICRIFGMKGQIIRGLARMD